ncbi:type II toxin-antitoxin system antitoxin SocA domain-containing protein [Actinomadura sp. 6K520]|uniref:type II toxin-antitoxin system antitoxin SocA domain-containing protein n=1 Tax=Actinomadura sp. 6K520 TaxID=2530364 RepID=UPI00140492C7|nr:type II toxin-antitoxin system antitoxin SocA domain-containing protein [Actinomadura sp. 6K520]
MTAPTPLRGPAAAIAYLLATARANGVRVNRTKLAKLLYLADLRAVEHGLPPGSGVEWRWRHYGPHSLRLKEVERDLHEAGHVRVEENVDPFTGICEYTIHLMDAPQTIIDAEFTKIVDGVLAEFGEWSAGQLRDLTYQTAPMQEAVKRGKREVRLDLAGGPPFPDLGPGLAHLRSWATRNPLPDDEPGGIDDLVEEMELLSERRAEATRHLLED